MRVVGLEGGEEREEGAAEEKEHGHLRQSGKREAPREVGEDEQTDPEQGELRIEESAAEKVGEHEGGGEKEEAGDADGAFGGGDNFTGGEVEIYPGDAEDERVEKRTERSLRNFGQGQFEISGVRDAEVHGQRARVKGGEALAAGDLASDLRLVHRLGHGESVELENEPHGGDQSDEGDDDEAPHPRGGAALLEGVQECLEIGLEAHGVRIFRVRDARSASGGGCGG